MIKSPISSARTHKAQNIVAALVPALIVVLGIVGFVSANKVVTVVVDGRAMQVKTQARDVAGVLDDAGVDHDADDVVTPAPDSQLRSGMTVVVRHTVPVTLEIGEKQLEVDVVGKTVADALVAAGYEPENNPAVTPALDTPLEPGIVVTAPARFVRVEQERVKLPFKTVVKKDPTRPVGVREVVREGRSGTGMRVWKVTVAEGIEASRTLSAECTVAPALDRVVVVGAAKPDPKPEFASWRRTAELSAAPTEGRRMRVVATGYSPQQPDLDYTMATGLRAGYGYIAVDPSVIPMGTRVWVPGYGYAVAADTGGAIKGARIDLCFDTVSEALEWGRRSVTIIILD